MKNTGKEYELFVGELQQAIFNSELYNMHKNINVEVNKIIKDNNGIDRQFDVYWEYEFGGIIYKTVIECKDYNSKISIEKIDALLGKTQDIPGLRLVFATKKGYQLGAKQKAEKNNIELLIVRNQQENDWFDEDGNSLIKKINIKLEVEVPNEINKFELIGDNEWIEKNLSLKNEEYINLSGMNNEIFIEDKVNNEKYSIQDLCKRLTPLEGKKHGCFRKTEYFDNAFIITKDLSLKIKGYSIEYSIYEPIIQNIEIDGTNQLMGVIEYLEKNKTKTIFRNGIIREKNIVK